MKYLFSNGAGYQRGKYLIVDPPNGKRGLAIQIGSFKKMDEEESYQLSKSEISDLIETLKKFNDEAVSSDIQEVEIID